VRRSAPIRLVRGDIAGYARQRLLPVGIERIEQALIGLRDLDVTAHVEAAAEQDPGTTRGRQGRERRGRAADRGRRWRFGIIGQE